MKIKAIPIAIVIMVLISPFAWAAGDNVDIKATGEKIDTKIDEGKVIDKTKESKKDVKNVPKELDGKIKIKDSDTSKYKVEKVDKHSIKITKDEVAGEHTKTEVSIDTAYLTELDKQANADGYIGYMRKVDGQVVDVQKIKISDISRGGTSTIPATFSEVIVSGFSGYKSTTYNNVVSGQVLDVTDDTPAAVTVKIDGTIPENTNDSYIIGYEWNTSSSSPTLRRIDVDGNTKTVPAGYFDVNPVYGNMWRCTINATSNNITYGLNPRGDGLNLTGAHGNVMTSRPAFYTKFEKVGALNRMWVSPYPRAGFELHPAFVQRGGIPVDAIFEGAYEASGYLDGSTFKLRSATGKQPITGGVSYTNLPNSGRLYIGDAETYANNIGTGYGITNIWTASAMQQLMYTEMGTLDAQTKLGKGVVDLSIGTGFAGRLTGANSSDTNIAVNGTGTGTGTNGLRPVVYRGMENPYSNVWKWVIGINYYDTVHRVLKKDGTGVVSATLTAGNYDESASAPPNTSTASSGYVNSVFTDEVLKYMMMGATTTGSSSTYLCDYYYLRAASATPTNLLLGGNWNGGLGAGVGSLTSSYGAGASYRTYGARLELIQNNYPLPDTDFGDSSVYIGNSMGTYTAYDVASGTAKTIDVGNNIQNVKIVNVAGTTLSSVTVVEYFTEDTTKISDTANVTAEVVHISHSSPSVKTAGTIAYQVAPLYSGTPALVSNNPNATVTRNVTSFIINTGYIPAGTTYNYTVTVANDNNHGMWLNRVLQWMGSGFGFVGEPPTDYTTYIGDQIEVTVS